MGLYKFSFSKGFRICLFDDSWYCLLTDCWNYLLAHFFLLVSQHWVLNHLIKCWWFILLSSYLFSRNLRLILFFQSFLQWLHT